MFIAHELSGVVVVQAGPASAHSVLEDETNGSPSGESGILQCLGPKDHQLSRREQGARGQPPLTRDDAPGVLGIAADGPRVDPQVDTGEPAGAGNDKEHVGGVVPRPRRDFSQQTAVDAGEVADDGGVVRLDTAVLEPDVVVLTKSLRGEREPGEALQPGQVHRPRVVKVIYYTIYS